MYQLVGTTGAGLIIIGGILAEYPNFTAGLAIVIGIRVVCKFLNDDNEK